LNNDSRFLINDSKISNKPSRYANDPSLFVDQNKINQSLNLSCIAGKKVNSSMGLEKLTVDEIFAPMEENFLSIKNAIEKKDENIFRFEQDRNNYNHKYELYEQRLYDKDYIPKHELAYNYYETTAKSKEERKKENFEEIIKAINKNDRYAILQAKKREILLTSQSQEHWTNKKINKTCESNKKNWDMEEAITRREDEVRKRWRREEEGLKTKDKRKYSNKFTRIITNFN
jgi:hypothetical protein